MERRHARFACYLPGAGRPAVVSALVNTFTTRSPPLDLGDGLDMGVNVVYRFGCELEGRFVFIVLSLYLMGPSI